MRSSLIASLAAVVALLVTVAWLLLGGDRETKPDAVPAAAPAAPTSGTGNAAQRGNGATAAQPGPATPDSVALPELDCTVPTGDVARVEGHPIAAATLCAEVAQLGGQVRPGAPAAVRLLASNVLDRLVDAALIDAALAQDHTAVSPADLDAALARVPLGPEPPVAMQLGPARDLTESLKRQGIDIAYLREQLRRRLALALVLDLRGSLDVTESEVEAEYRANPDRWRTGLQVVVKPYIARLAPGAPAAVAAQARAAADEFARAVTHEEPGPAAARLRLQGLPSFKLEAQSSEPELAAAALTLQPGAWSPPVPTRTGFVVLHAEAREEGQARSLDEARADIRRLLTGTKRAAEQERVLAALRAQARVEVLVRLGAEGAR